MNPIVTVVIPCYNVEKYIIDAVDCILNQTFRNWELILIDDKSTDNTLQIIRDFETRDDRIRVIALENNTGGAHIPRAIAIKEANGEWIYSLDADDFCDLDTLETMYKRALETNADSIYQSLQGVSEDKRIDSKRVLPVNTFNFSAVLTGDDLFKLNIGGWQTNSNGAFIRKSVYLKSIEAGESAYCGSYTDDLIGRYVFLNSKLCAFTTVKYYNRVNPNSVTRNMTTKRLEVLPAYSYISDLARKLFPDDSLLLAKAEQNLWMVVYMIGDMYIRHNDSIKKEDKKIFKNTLFEYWQKIDPQILSKIHGKTKVLFFTKSFNLFLVCVFLRVCLSKMKRLIIG